MNKAHLYFQNISMKYPQTLLQVTILYLTGRSNHCITLLLQKFLKATKTNKKKKQSTQ